MAAAAAAAASRAIKEVFVKRGTCYSHNGHVNTTYICTYVVVTMNQKRIISSSLIW